MSRTQMAWLGCLVGGLLMASGVFAQVRGANEQALNQAVRLFDEGLRYQTGEQGGTPDPKRALVFYLKALQVYPKGYPEPPPLLYNVGLIYFSQEDFGQAQVYFIKSARAAQELRKIRRGKAAIQAAVEYEALARNGLGTCYQKDGKMRDAEQQFRSAIRLDPQLAEAHFNLVNLLSKEERWEEAEGALRQAKQLAPDSRYEIFNGRQEGKKGREGFKGIGGVVGILIFLASLLGYYVFLRVRRH